MRSQPLGLGLIVLSLLSLAPSPAHAETSAACSNNGASVVSQIERKFGFSFNWLLGKAFDLNYTTTKKTETPLPPCEALQAARDKKELDVARNGKSGETVVAAAPEASTRSAL